ncbi:unnamed protein product [Boreogadus saida]
MANRRTPLQTGIEVMAAVCLGSGTASLITANIPASRSNFDVKPVKCFLMDRYWLRSPVSTPHLASRLTPDLYLLLNDHSSTKSVTMKSMNGEEAASLMEESPEVFWRSRLRPTYGSSGGAGDVVRQWRSSGPLGRETVPSRSICWGKPACSATGLRDGVSSPPTLSSTSDGELNPAAQGLVEVTAH